MKIDPAISSHSLFGRRKSSLWGSRRSDPGGGPGAVDRRARARSGERSGAEARSRGVVTRAALERGRAGGRERRQGHEVW